MFCVKSRLCERWVSRSINLTPNANKVPIICVVILTRETVASLVTIFLCSLSISLLHTPVTTHACQECQDISTRGNAPENIPEKRCTYLYPQMTQSEHVLLK